MTGLTKPKDKDFRDYLPKNINSQSTRQLGNFNGSDQVNSLVNLNMTDRAKPMLNRVASATNRGKYSNSRRYIDNQKLQQFSGKPPSNP